MFRSRDPDDDPIHEPLGCTIERARAFDPKGFEQAVKYLLEASGIEIDAVHTGKTAQRVRDLWQRRLLDGYDIDPAEALGAGLEDRRRDMVVMRGIAVHGVCPRHLLPFCGVAHVAYLPNGRLHGFDRVARLVDAISHRFTYQEWVANEIARALMAHGKARGAACLLQSEPSALLMGEGRRGNERIVTHGYTGEFEQNTQARMEFLHAIQC